MAPLCGPGSAWASDATLCALCVLWEAVHTKVDAYGLVQGVCGSPDFGHAGTATEGQAFFLLMEAAHRDS
jgi:unsaturated rhamnogalacturonyl hydrolase